jgi:hypothetical protein
MLGRVVAESLTFRAVAPLASLGSGRCRSVLFAILTAACAADLTNPSESAGYKVVFCGASGVSVDVGESVLPAGAVSGCYLKATPGAKYVLAYLDTRAITSAQTAREGTFADYTARLTVVGTDTVQALVRRARSIEPAGSFDAALDIGSGKGAHVSVQADYPYEWPTPWTLNEGFEIQDPYLAAIRPLRVLRIYDGRFVFAWDERGDSARLGTFLPQLDSAFPVVSQWAFPLLRRTFADVPPTTSPGSGQYLIILSDTLTRNGESDRGASWGASLGDTTCTWTYIQVATQTTYVVLASLLAHEIAHSYQRIYLDATRPAGAMPGWGASLWGEEGGANLISYEMTRRYAGIALDANYDWRNPGPTPAEQWYASRAQPGYGQFTDGYDDAMGFLRDLVLRRMGSGESVDDAVRAVSLGAIEGWYGYDGVSHRTGMTKRMQDRLGNAWQPSSAMLEWTLSHAADDRTPSPAFQDRASLRIWDIPADQEYGWRPDTSVSSAAGGTALVTRRYGSPGFSYLLDDGGGVLFAISSQTATLEWQLVRVK